MIRVGIVGYGNVAAGVVKALALVSDMKLVAVFTRRDPKIVSLQEGNAPILHIDTAKDMKNDIDVMLLCGGSATDLPEQAPYFAKMFNTVDSYDNHAKIPEYMAEIDKAASKTTAIVSVGWDPGLFSMMRVLFESILPDGKNYTFWGEGVSQGHSDALRRIDGVLHAVQYTVPIEDSINEVRSGKCPSLTTAQKHKRICYVALKPDVNKEEIEKTIKCMPHYFQDYDTTVHFVEINELFENHSKMPHGGLVMHSGNTGNNNHVTEFSLKLESNPEFTGSVMVAYARAAYRLSKEKNYGAKTVFDVPLSYLSQKDRNLLIKELL